MRAARRAEFLSRRLGGTVVPLSVPGGTYGDSSRRFNLVLRDIKKLKEVLKYYLGLGISIKDSFVLNDFVSSRMPENIIMGLGVDATHIFFKKNKYLDPFKGFILKHISNNKTLSKLSKIISNKGLSF